MFAVIGSDPTAEHYRPHAFDLGTATGLLTSTDVYLGAIHGGSVVAYGMLRWAGYPNPSLGIYVCPSYRGIGLGRRMMEALHAAARDRGSSRVRLRVHPENHIARRLYDATGYEFSGEIDRGELVGWFKL